MNRRGLSATQCRCIGAIATCMHGHVSVAGEYLPYGSGVEVDGMGRGFGKRKRVHDLRRDGRVCSDNLADWSGSKK